MSERYIVTSALPYINGVKHLGNLIGSLLPADVYTRYLKLQDKDVIYICGTDDHGTPAELSALAAGLPVDEYCEKLYKVQKQIYEDFGLNFDYFGRTSDQENHEITQEIFMGLYENGYISEKFSTQLYSLTDERYLPDRYVIGQCPNCGYEGARGDQCENCTKLLDPTDLINPRSAISGSTEIEQREVRHLYIDLPKLQSKVETWINTQDHWSVTSLSIAKKWLREGLKERSITRNLDWGIDVPLKGFEDVKFYVWFDAPIGYISITKKWAKLIKNPKKFQYYWKSPKTKLIQFMGIDNVPFHSLTFPSSIIGSDLGYPLVHNLKGFQWLNYEKGKFSTSQNRGVFTDTALELYPADYWRYYLLLIAPERQDTDFQWKGFQSAVNNDLNNLLGNLLNRFTTFCDKYFSSVIPKYQIGDLERELISNADQLLKDYKTTFDQIEFQKPLKALRKFWQDCNRYFQQSEPWKSTDKELDKTASVVGSIAHALRIIAVLFAPIAPSSAEKIYSVLGYPGNEVHDVKWNEVKNWDILIGNKIVKLDTNLFIKIPNKDISKLEETYGSASNEVSKPKVKKKKKSKKADDNLIEYDDFAKLKLITAIILKAEKHPDADSLIVLTVDDGKRQDRTICAGIAGDYNPTKLIGKQIVIIDNLKPRKLRGITSEGMILAAEDDEGISLLQPDRKVSTGVQVR
ncbi:MAG: methionine--tRNA ligase [Candidatus Heimdallarchaeota archaeon]|nr:methionine--tRNA ligase [Candidatus Heimdallarchaeota archaeon]